MDRCMRSRGRGRWTSGMISTTTASGNANGCLRMSRSQETVTRRNGPQERIMRTDPLMEQLKQIADAGAEGVWAGNLINKTAARELVRRKLVRNSGGSPASLN